MTEFVSFFLFVQILVCVLAVLILFWIAPVLIIYAWLFRRVSRPNYALTAGEYCYARLGSALPRKEFFYRAGRSRLKGYYYEGSESAGLVVLSHGFRSGADDFLPLIRALVAQGYSVFSYDGTGTYGSRGASMVGMCQALIDLDCTLAFLAQEQALRARKIYLIGHSLGGYAALSVLALHPEVKACVALAPVRDGTTVMVETAEQFVGKLALTGKPIFAVLQRLCFGRYTRHNSIHGINSSTVPILIVQGVHDEILSCRKHSLCAYKHAITNPNVEFLEVDGVCGSHSGLWHSEASVRYKESVDKAYKKLRSSRNGRTRAQRESYIEGIDHALYSEVSAPLVDCIAKTFGKVPVNA